MRIRVLTVFLLISATLLAVPAHKAWRMYRQADGTMLELQLVGDEHFHYYLTRDSIPVVDENDAFYYARFEGDRLRASTVLAHDVAVRDRNERLVARHYKSAPAPQFLAGRLMKKASPRQVSGGYVGSKKGLIILANFSDVQFEGYTEETADSIRQAYDRLANQEGYTNKWGAIGSVHDYFHDQSNGLFDLTFDVVGPVNLEKLSSFYGRNRYGSDIYAARMIVDCCQAVDSMVNFKDYDWDDDGVVEEVFVLYAGKGEATGGSPNTIWPHMWTLEEAKEYDKELPELYQPDSVTINVYACSNEIYEENVPMGLGVFCHEFSHCLGLPDLYDTNTGENYGMAEWSILDMGSYNGPLGIGWVPAGYTSYERNFAGWLDYTELVTDTVVQNMLPLNAPGAEAFRVTNDSVPTEYYLLENRNQTQWDSYLPGSGLLILHVDYDQEIWDNNYVNATGHVTGNDHQRLTIFHASNSRYIGSHAYPYLKRDSLTDLSSPSATLFNPNIDGEYLMHKPITAISRNDSTAEMSFQFHNRAFYPDTTLAVGAIPLHQTGQSTIYRIDGTAMGRMDAQAHREMPPGAYIIRREDGRTEKFVIKH